ncbi:uncharacterized protein [Littorina saxatilis]
MSGMKITIGKVNGGVYNGNEIIINHNQDSDGTTVTGLSHQDRTSSRPIPVPSASQPFRESSSPSSPESLRSSCPVSFSGSPPQSDAVQSTIQEHDLPAPTPATDDCPPDGGTEHDERDSDQAQANYSHGPVAAVQPSDDYRAVGGRGNSILADRDGGREEVYDPTAMHELKTVQNSYDNTEHAAEYHSSGRQPSCHGQEYDLTYVKAPKVSQKRQSDPSLSTDGPEQTPVSSPTLSPSPNLPSDFSREQQTKEESRRERETPEEGLGESEPKRGSTTPEGERREWQNPGEEFGETDAGSVQGHDSFSITEGENEGPVIQDYGSISSRHSGTVSLGAEEREHSEETTVIPPYVHSAPPSLHMDGGGNILTGNTEATVPDTSQTGTRDIYVVHHKNMLFHDEESSVFVVESKTSEEIIQRASESGCFPDGSSQLLQMTWLEHLSFNLSCWKLMLKSETSDPNQLKDLTKHLCKVLRAWDAECIRQVTKQLHRTHKAFFQSMLWDKGLVVYLGHANLEKREELLESPLKEECQTALLQLLPDFALDHLAWGEPVVYDEEEKEDGGQSALSETISHADTIGAEDISTLTSLASSSSSGESFQSQQPVSVSAESNPSAQGSPPNSNTDSRLGNICRLLAEEVERWETQWHPKEPLEQLDRKLAAQAESHGEEMHKMTETMKKLQSELHRCQGESQLLTQLQQENKELKEEMEGRILSLEKQLEDQAETIRESIQQERMLAKEEREQGQLALKEEMQSRCATPLDQMKAALEEKMMQNQQNMLEEFNQKHKEELQAAREEMKREHQLGMEKMLQKQREMLEQVTKKHEEDKNAAQEEIKEDHQNQLEEIKRNLMNAFEEKINMKFEALHHEVTKKDEQQRATMTEIQKLRKELDDRLRAVQPAGAEASVIVGHVEGVEGATGGEDFVTRNLFSSALDESEEATLKLKGKDEQMASNQLEDRLHVLPFVPGMEQATFDRPKCPQTMLVHPRSENSGAGPDNMGATVTDVPSSPRNGARSKTNPRKTQKGREKKGGSPPAEASGKTSDTTEKAQGRSATASSTEVGSTEEEDLTKAEQFLDWISIRGNLSGSEDMAKTISKSVNAALKEEEAPAPRAKCLDTILCLDVSESIVRGGHLETVKKTAMDFVDGIEDLMDEMDLEENVAVVAVGGNARVVQHLTNDLTLVRDAIDTLDDSGGRSPFMQALLVCLAANKGRGGIVSISGVYKVRPRIIFITDGLPTDETQDTGPDLQSNKNQTSFALVQLLSQLASKKHKSTPRPINWVPIGQKADKSFLLSLAQLGGGELVAPDNIRQLCRYYKIQQTIGRLYKMVKNKGSNLKEETKLGELLTAIAYDTITPEEKDYIVEAVTKLQNAPQEEEEPEADDFDNVYEDKEKVKGGELLALGTRVVRGPDWKWKNQDTDGPGTVIQHSKKDNWIYVKWDNGVHNAYRYGQEGASDIVETQHHPRLISPDSDRLDFGVRVVRGPDWRWDNNNDGRGVGTVIRCRESDGRVKVRWDKTGEIFKYNYSSTKGKEVQIHMPEFQRYHGNEEDVTQDGQPEVDPNKTIPMWKWRDEMRQWRLYDEVVSSKLEMEYRKRPKASCVVRRAGKNRRVSFKMWQEKAVDGGHATEIQREMVDEERKNDLLAIELSLQYP